MTTLTDQQLADALRIVEAIRNVHPDAPVHLTGHSLGGGLATAVAIHLGLEATVFNPAGVRPETLGDLDRAEFERRGETLADVFQVEGGALELRTGRYMASDRRPLSRHHRHDLYALRGSDFRSIWKLAPG